MRTLGGTGSMAWHIDMVAGVASTSDSGVSTVDTTSAMDVTVTAEWNNAKAGNIFECQQGFMMYKN